jgi:hypothetical protein
MKMGHGISKALNQHLLDGLKRQQKTCQPERGSRADQYTSNFCVQEKAAFEGTFKAPP